MCRDDPWHVGMPESLETPRAAGFGQAAAPPPPSVAYIAASRSRTLLPAALPCSQLGIAERVVVGLMGRLAGHAVVEPVPGSSDASQPAAYRLLPPYSGGAAAAVQQQQQQRRSGRRGGGSGSSMQPKVARPGPNSSQVGAGRRCPTFELGGCSICAAELSVTRRRPSNPPTRVNSLPVWRSYPPRSMAT